MPARLEPDVARTGAHDARRTELRASLDHLRARIRASCASSERDPSGVTLIAITKTFPIGDAELLAGLGVTDLGENRDQEAKAKAAEMGASIGDGDGGDGGPRVRWHFVGQLQTNKARSVVRYARAVHSVDRGDLVDALAGAVARQERPPLTVFVQVDLDGSRASQARGRGGVEPGALFELADRVGERTELELAGLMAVAPRDGDARAAFDRLAELSAQLRRSHPAASAVSAGMSDDFEVAIAAGATHVRVGSALLGPRPAIVG